LVFFAVFAALREKKRDIYLILSPKNEPSPFVRQAEAFLDAIETRNEARNPPDDALLDVRIAEAISISAREHRVVLLED